jgi:hypothetical protein
MVIDSDECISLTKDVSDTLPYGNLTFKTPQPHGGTRGLLTLKRKQIRVLNLTKTSYEIIRILLSAKCLTEVAEI